MTTKRKDMRHLFARMHLSFIEDGLLAAINQEAGAGSVIALLVIVKHMDSEGIAYPSQQLIAKESGVTERTAGTWIRSLLSFKWNGRPIMTVEKMDNGKGHLYNVYRVLPASQWSIFHGDVHEEDDGMTDVIAGIGRP
jgi:hypothetical protein